MMAAVTRKQYRTPESKSEKIVKAARRRLDQNAVFRGRAKLIRINSIDGRLILYGRLPSYYLKQVLQTTLRDIDGVTSIENRVDVLWPSES